MSLGGSFSFKVSRSGVEVMFFVFIHVVFFSRLGGCSLSITRCHSLQYLGCYSRDVDQALALVDFVALEYFNFDPFLEMSRT